MNEMLQSLLASVALEKFQKRRKQELTFADACRFWGITGTQRGDAIDDCLNYVSSTLSDAETAGGKSIIRLNDMRIVTANEIAELIEVHDHLLERFSRHLDILREI